MHVRPDRGVLGLLKAANGQRHLADGQLSHFRRLRKPLGLTLGVKKAIAFSSLLKATRGHTIQCLLCPASTAPCPISEST